MDNKQLYELLDFPKEVIHFLCEYEQKREIKISAQLKEKLLHRATWDEGINELKSLVEKDENGLKILWELLNMVCEYSYGEYVKRAIPEKIFVDTMYWCTRTLNNTYKRQGKYAFTLAWWFPRLLSLNEFRLGVLSFEFVEGEKRKISLHIPSDGSIERSAVIDSVKRFFDFRDKYFAEWKDAPIVCSTWLLAPALKELLGAGSRILAFQDMFEIDSVDLEATWFVSYVFPGHKEIDESLQEDTSLQRNMKKYLLEGKNVGVAKGHLKDISKL